MRLMKNKKFDCVEMMHLGAEHIDKQIKGMTIEEELKYWQQQTAELRKIKREKEKMRKAS